MSERPGTIFVYQNDVEAVCVARRAKRARWRVVPDARRPWGTQPLPVEDVAELESELRPGEQVVFVEAPTPELEDRLRGRGHPVTVIDHHLYVNGRGEILDRRRDTASLEQFAALFPLYEKGELVPLDADERLVAANDRGYWPALVEAALELFPDEGPSLPRAPTEEEKKERATYLASRAERMLEKIRETRSEDLARSGAGTAELLEEATAAVREAVAAMHRQDPEAELRISVLGCGRPEPGNPELIVVRAPERLKPVLLDALYEAHVEGLEVQGIRFGSGKARFNRLSSLKAHPLEALIVFERTLPAGKRHPVALEYSGPAHRRALLDQLLERCLASGDPVGRLRYYAGGSGRGCYLGADAAPGEESAVEDLADRLANALLEGNRPTERWAVTFLQVMSLKPDALGRDDAQAPEGSPAPRPVWLGGNNTLEPEEAGPAERSYLHAYLQPFLTPTRSEQLRGTALGDGRHEVPSDFILRTFASRWGKCGDTGFAISVENPTRTLLETPVAHAKLHFGPGNIVIVEWMLHGGRQAGSGRLFEQLLEHGTALSKAIESGTPRQGWEPSAEDPYPGLPAPRPFSGNIDTVADVLDLTDGVRRVYSAYVAYSEAERISTCLTKGGFAVADTVLGSETNAEAPAPTGWFRALLTHLLRGFSLTDGQTTRPMRPEDLEHVFDDRSHVLSTIAGLGTAPEEPAAKAAQRMLLARQTTVEPHGATHFYHPPFAEKELADGLYRRFETAPAYPGAQNLFALTDRSIAHAGFGFFAAVVVIKHVASQYKRLFLAEVISSAVFHRLSVRLAQEYQIRNEANRAWERSDGGLDAEERWEEALDRVAARVQRIREEAIAYANGLWFTEISPQTQGREMHRILSRQMRTCEHYEELMAEIGRADNLEAADEARRAERRRSQITVLSTILAAFLTVFTLFSGLDTARSALSNTPASWLILVGAVAAGAVVAGLGLTGRRSLGTVWRDMRKAFSRTIRLFTRSAR